MGALHNRRSRCSDKESGPYRWFDYVDEEHPSVIHLEEWLQSLPFFAQSDERGKIDAVMDKARQGELWDSGDAKSPLRPITSDPELFELRHMALTKPLRLYHAEPSKHPDLLLLLHRHIKKDVPPQQEEIDFAVERYRRQSA